MLGINITYVFSELNVNKLAHEYPQRGVTEPPKSAPPPAGKQVPAGRAELTDGGVCEHCGGCVCVWDKLLSSFKGPNELELFLKDLRT